MNIEQAAAYWKQRLAQGKPIYRVRIRRLLELAEAERRGWAISRRITDALSQHGLYTDPDFQSAWIDGLVTVRLTGTDGEEDGFQGIEPDDTTEEQAASLIDPALDSTPSCSEGVEAVGEDLFAAEGAQGLVEVPTQAREPGSDADDEIDPVRRIGSLASANRGVISVNPQDTLQAATTLMVFDGFSQLAVMQNERNVRGVISWESIAKRSLHLPAPAMVADCQVPAQVIEADGTLFDALPTIEKFGYVLVRSKGKITGIVTASDVAEELRSLSYAFVSIGTIEGLIRQKLIPCLHAGDSQYLEQHSRARKEQNFSLMTFGENVRLFEREEVWNRLNINIDKVTFIQRLVSVRNIRNDVMHFNPDPLGPKQKKEIEQMEQFLREMFL